MLQEISGLAQPFQLWTKSQKIARLHWYFLFYAAVDLIYNSFIKCHYNLVRSNGRGSV